MARSKNKQKFVPGNAIYVPVEHEHIDDSDPCNKDNCMLTWGFTGWLDVKPWLAS
jgi:hypothetical protein